MELGVGDVGGRGMEVWGYLLPMDIDRRRRVG